MVAGELSHFGREIEGAIGPDDLGFANAPRIKQHLPRRRMAGVVLPRQIEMIVAEWNPNSFPAPAHMDEFGAQRQKFLECSARLWCSIQLEFGCERKRAGLNGNIGQGSVSLRNLYLVVCFTEAGLDPPLRDIPKCGEDQIIDCGHGKEFENQEFFLNKDLGPAQKLFHRDD